MFQYEAVLNHSGLVRGQLLSVDNQKKKQLKHAQTTNCIESYFFGLFQLIPVVQQLLRFGEEWGVDLVAQFFFVDDLDQPR